MFRLDDEVQTRKPSIGGVVRQHDQLAGAGRRAGIEHMRQQPLGGPHPRAAGSDHLGAFRHRLGAIGHGGNGLRAAGLEDFRDARHPRRDERRIIELAIGAWRRDDANVLYTRDGGRDRGHQHGGGKRPLAARHITGNRGNGRGAIAGEYAGADFVKPHLLRLLILVKAADRGGGEFQSFTDFGVEGFFGQCEVSFSGGDFRGLNRRMIELAGEAG